MAWSFTNDRPIFQQIIDIIVLEIISGRYRPGEKLDTVRDFAVSAGVNPNTMQRALTEIENTGIIYTKRGDGRYVVEDMNIINEIRSKYVADKAKEFTVSLKKLGLSETEILDAVKRILDM